MNLTEKKYPTIACCGLDCGLCPRYYTVGTSRCPGCAGPDFFNKHPSCSFITCCVKQKHLETCGECSEFPCKKFKSDEEYQQVKLSSSYPPYKKIMSNLRFIREHGVQEYMEQQARRIGLLETMIQNFDDGRSKSFFCRAAALLDIKDLDKALEQATNAIAGAQINDKKMKADTLKTILKTSDPLSYETR